MDHYLLCSILIAQICEIVLGINIPGCHQVLNLITEKKVAWNIFDLVKNAILWNIDTFDFHSFLLLE